MPKELRTSDLALATFLNLDGHSHTALEMLDKRAAVWVFNGNGEVHAAAEAYHDGTATVDPRVFMQEVREVRDELYKFLKANNR